MMNDLRRAGIRCVRQDAYEIYYKQWKVGGQRLDVFVADEVVFELKVVPKLTPLHQAQTMSYLKTTRKQVGLLFNIGGPSPEIKRVIFTRHGAVTPKRTAAINRIHAPHETLVYPELSHQVIGYGRNIRAST